jgi:hypothetical protein
MVLADMAMTYGSGLSSLSYSSVSSVLVAMVMATH